MKHFTCTVCPRGCHLSVQTADDGTLTSVAGNACNRGAVYAAQELTHPVRVLTATCPLDTDTADLPLTFPRRVPLKTTAPIPRSLLCDLARELLATPVPLPVKTAQVILSNWRGLDITVIATRDIDNYNPIHKNTEVTDVL